MRLRLRLGRRQSVPLQPYTGPSYCGCRWLNGDHVVPCPDHAGLRVASPR